MLLPRLTFTVATLLLLTVAASVHAQDVPREDLAPCNGSDPQPSPSGTWQVAFCNRTGHDLVMEFRDNDCPAQNWGRRGDVYRKSLRRDESTTFYLCYANEQQLGRSPAPGTPTLRIPGGKGIVTTWSVVGDCGEHSDHLYLDARSFYDRGDYKGGIILLQYPAGAPHCLPGSGGSQAAVPKAAAAAAGSATTASPSASPPAVARVAGSGPTPGAPASTPVATAAAIPGAAASTPVAPATAAATGAAAAAGAAAAQPAPGATPNPTGAQPQLYARIDNTSPFARSVQVIATNGAGEPNFRCSFILVLGFSDGGSYTDRLKGVEVTSGQHDVVVAKKSYLKTIVKADLTSAQCSPR